jgi:hypothetical protein
LPVETSLNFMAKNFAGFDSAVYPGDSKMQSLFDQTNLYWCGFYLGPRFKWSPHFSKIKGMGWGVAPIYTGKQANSQKLQAIKLHYARQTDALRDALYANGKADGVEAVQQASAAGIPAPTILYFDVEITTPDAGWLAYYRGWSRAVVEKNYSVGIYTRSDHASWLNAQLMTQPEFDVCFPKVWIAKYTKANPNNRPVPEGDFLSHPFPEPNPSDSWRGATQLAAPREFRTKVER